MTARTATFETRHVRRATELSPAKTKQENKQALKTIKRRVQPRRLDHVTHRVYSWKDMALALLCTAAAFLSIWVWYLVMEG